VINASKIKNKTALAAEQEAEAEAAEALKIASSALPEILEYIASKSDAPQSLKDKAAKVKK
jgi:hypothetical protein